MVNWFIQVRKDPLDTTHILKSYHFEKRGIKYAQMQFPKGGHVCWKEMFSHEVRKEVAVSLRLRFPVLVMYWNMLSAKADRLTHRLTSEISFGF